MSTYIKDTSDIEADRQQRLDKYQKMIKRRQNISSQERLMKSLHLSYGCDKNSLTLDLDAYRNEISKELNDQLVDFLNQTEKKITTVFCNDVYKTPCKLFYQIHGNKNDKLIVEDKNHLVHFYNGPDEKQLYFKPFSEPINATMITTFFWQTKKPLTISPKDCRRVFFVRDVVVEILPLFSKCSCLRYCNTVEIGWNGYSFDGIRNIISQVDLEKYKLDIILTPVNKIVMKQQSLKDRIIYRDLELEKLVNK